MKRSIVLGVALTATLALPAATEAQSVFRSTQSVNLPTTTMLPRAGNWMFEISHRFDTPISAGADAFWGFDGPANIRLGLQHQLTDDLLLGITRVDLLDNVELNGKYRFFAADDNGQLLEIAGQGGIAWNTQAFPVGGQTDNEMQAYVQLAINTLIGDALALGLVPTFIHNPRLLDASAGNSVAIGIHGQYYTDGALSFIGEWIVSEAVTDQPFDTGTFGIEIRTRGHFFKIVVSNQRALGSTQVLPGSSLDFTDLDTWGLGFNLTRLLPF